MNPAHGRFRARGNSASASRGFTLLEVFLAFVLLGAYWIPLALVTPGLLIAAILLR